MKLLLHRSHRPGLFHKVIYILDVRAQLSEEEHRTLMDHALTGVRLYERAAMADRGRGLFGFLYRLWFGAGNLTVRVADLLEGRRIELADLSEILAIEDLVTAQTRTFSQLLDAASHYDGEQVVEL